MELLLNIYEADLNFKKINFELLFQTNEFWKKYNVFSGGRIEKFKENKILFSIGFSKDYKAPQNKQSLLGKIIAVDLNTNEYEINLIWPQKSPRTIFL